MIDRLIKAIFLLAVGVALGIFVAIATRAESIQAAAPTLSANCVEEATVADMKVYFCEGDIGPDFLINSFGFMVLEN